MKPTIIRGTKIVPGSTVYVVQSLETGEQAYRAFSNSTAFTPEITSFKVIGTNGESFALTRGMIFRRSERGAFNYVDEPEKYYVTLDEATEALNKELDKVVPMARKFAEEQGAMARSTLRWFTVDFPAILDERGNEWVARQRHRVETVPA